MVAYGTQILTAAVLTPPLNLQSTGTSAVFGAGTTGDTSNRVQLGADGDIRFGSGAGAVDAAIVRESAGVIGFASGTVQLTNGNLDITAAGRGLRVAEGSNAKQGTFALSGAATTVVANTSVTASSRIQLTPQALGTVTAPSALAVTAISPGVSFTVTPSQPTDTSTVVFEIFEPG